MKPLLALLIMATLTVPFIHAAETKCYVFLGGQVCLNPDYISGPNGTFYFANNNTSGGGSDGNNYTTSLTVNQTGDAYSVVITRSGASTLIANFTVNATGGNGSNGTVTSLTEGAGINLTPDTITSTGSIGIANLLPCNPVTEYSVYNGSHWLCDNDGGGTDTNNYTTNFTVNNTGNTFQTNTERNGISTNLTSIFTIIQDNQSWNQTLANTLYYPIASNPAGFYNVTTLPADQNNYTTSASFAGRVLTLARNGMTSLTASLIDDSILLNWLNITGRPTDLANFTNTPLYVNQTYANSTYGNQSGNYTCSAGFAVQSGAFNTDGTQNATTCVAIPIGNITGNLFTNYFTYSTSATNIQYTQHLQFFNASMLLMNATLNHTFNGTTRVFANGCTEIANTTGIYTIC